MKKIWKIFELREMSIEDKWDGFDHSSHILIELFDNEFSSEFEAEKFLLAQKFNNKEMKISIQSIFRF